MRFRLFILGIVFLFGLVVFSVGAQATAFTVINTNDSGPGSLRQAILDANLSPGTDTIAFNIPGPGPHTIQPTLALPTITGPVVIDGYTQLGASPNTNPITQGSNAVLRIELDGSSAGAPGLRITAGSSTVRGLVINRFNGGGILLTTNGGNVIEGNFIGTDVTGTSDLVNSGSGVQIADVPNNTIGGTTAGARNIISGNAWGILIAQASATGNFVQGNFIGTDVTGAVALGNCYGVLIEPYASNNIIGGTTVEARNVISGNRCDGIAMISLAEANVVQGNLIGTKANGTEPLGNEGNGVVMSETGNNTIGGTGVTPGACDGPCNTIAFNGLDGVASCCGGVAILSNSIFSNEGLGIDVPDDGVTPNDPGDGDDDYAQNFPILTSATRGVTGITIVGTLNSRSNTTFRLEFFANTAADPSGHGEGESFIGSANVATDGSGDGSFTVTFPTAVPPGQFITATATDPSNNTSEFSEGISPGLEVDFVRVGYVNTPFPTGTAWGQFEQLFDGTYTHIIATFLEPNPDGTFVEADAIISFGASLIQQAQANGVKVLASVGGSKVDYSTYVAIASNTSAKQAFIDNALSVMHVKGYDGLDLNFEKFGNATEEDHDLVNSLAYDLAQAIKNDNADNLVTVALPPSYYLPLSLASEFVYVNSSEVVQSCEFVNSYLVDFAHHLGFDFFYGATGPEPDKPNGPYRAPGEIQYLSPPQQTQTIERSVYGALSYLLDQGCFPQKITGGIPFYSTNPIESWSDVRNRQNWELIPLDYNYLEKAEPCTSINWVNDPDAVRAKIAKYEELGLGGVMVWQVGHEGPTGDLSKALKNSPVLGGRIAFHSYTEYDDDNEDGYHSIDGAIHVFDLNTNTPYEVAEMTIANEVQHAMNPKFSASGSNLVFMGLPRTQSYSHEDDLWANHLDIFLYDFGADTLTNLSEQAGMSSFGSVEEDPDLSPDGQRVIFKRDRADLWEMDLATFAMSQFTFDGSSSEESGPRYSPDGQWVAYWVGTKENADIYRRPVGGGPAELLVNSLNIQDMYPAFQDGDHLLYSRWTSATQHDDQIYVHDLVSGTNDPALFNLEASDDSDPFAIAGNLVGFSSNRVGGKGGWDLYISELGSSAPDWLEAASTPKHDLGGSYTPHVVHYTLVQWLLEQQAPNCTVPTPALGRSGLEVSYIISPSDPSYPFLSNRSWIYDDALAVIAWSMEGECQAAEDALSALAGLVEPDGKLGFSHNTLDAWSHVTHESGAAINEGGSFSASDTTLTVTDGSKFVKYQTLLIENELVFITNDPVGNDLPVARGRGVTTPTIHNDETDIYIYGLYRTGAIAWGGYSYVFYQRMCGDGQFQTTAETIADWVLTMQDPTSGSVRGGPDVNWFSTEHNIDAYFFLRDIGLLIGNADYLAAAGQIKQSLLTNHWNSSYGCFQQGIGDPVKALDTASWGALFQLAIGDSGRANSCLNFLENTFQTTVECSIAGVTQDISGYKPYTGTVDGINWGVTDIAWSEGSLGVAMAYQRAGNQAKFDEILSEIWKMQGPDDGIVYACPSATDFPDWESVAGTAWMVMLQSGNQAALWEADNTPAGTSVVVEPVDATTGTTPVTVTFSEIAQPSGNTSLTTSSVGPTPPAGFQLGDPPIYYDLTTTAVFTPPIEVCIDYSGISFTGAEEDLRLLHFEDTVWEDHTLVPVDTANKMICASVTSLSPFAVFEPENHPPVADAGPDQTPECTGFDGAIVTLDGSGSSDPDSDPLNFLWSASGIIFDVPTSPTPTATFPFGTTTVTLVINDGTVDSEPDTVDITVQNTTPPVITLVSDNPQVIECPAAYVEWGATATDACEGDLTGSIVIDASAVDTSTPGSYQVTYNVSDSSGNAATQVVRTVVVQDTTPPVITVATEPITLWPPNHKYHTIAVSDFVTSITDLCDADVPLSNVVITSVSSDEAEDATGGGDGNTLNDIVLGMGCQSVDLRAERQGGGNGRVYTIHVAASDASGNTGEASFQVHVPHDKKSTATDDGAAYAVDGCQLHAAG